MCGRDVGRCCEGRHTGQSSGTTRCPVLQTTARKRVLQRNESAPEHPPNSFLLLDLVQIVLRAVILTLRVEPVGKQKLHAEVISGSRRRNHHCMLEAEENKFGSTCCRSPILIVMKMLSVGSKGSQTQRGLRFCCRSWTSVDAYAGTVRIHALLDTCILQTWH